MNEKPNFKNIRPVVTSPLPFLLAACGGGGGAEVSVVINDDPDQEGSDITTAAMATPVTFPLTNNDFKDFLTQGSYWASESGILTYAVAGGFNDEAWHDNDFIMARFSEAMSNIAYFTNMKVQDLGFFNTPLDAGDAGATIVIAPDRVLLSEYLPGTSAVGLFPNTTPDEYGELGYPNMAGDIYINLTEADFAGLPIEAYEQGGVGYSILLHEIGHAIGLKHPFDDGGSGRPLFYDLGLDEYNDMSYTIMAYDDIQGGVLYSPSTFMLVDALILMDLYGVNETTNAGDTTHYIYETGTRQTIWDASGVDTIDLTSFVRDTVVYLSDVNLNSNLDIAYNYIEFAAELPLEGRDVVHTTWLLGDYENIIAGAGDDEITGNSLDNIIRGNAGNDVINGALGDDVLYGDDGADTFIMVEGEGNDIIKDFEIGIDTCHIYEANGVRNDFVGSLESTIEGYGLYLFGDGSSVEFEGVLYTDLLLVA